VIGAVPGAPAGSWFATRKSLFQAGVHRTLKSKICASSDEGLAESVLLLDQKRAGADFGNVVYFMGSGGEMPDGQQNSNQHMAGLNAFLLSNLEKQIPVRLIRTIHDGFRYDGLFAVESAWLESDLDRFQVCMFRLMKTDLAGEGVRSNPREQISLSRLVRDSSVAIKVKQLHEFECQFCGLRLETVAGPYAEGAHIVPLSANGTDALENILCLCPNHHVLFDHGALQIADDWTLRNRDGELLGAVRRVLDHPISPENIRTHRLLFGFAEPRSQNSSGIIPRLESNG
jgi:putative restriction endonuclease